MSSLWIRKAIGESTYKALAVCYWKLHYFSVVAPIARRASRQFQKNKDYLHIDLHFGAGYGAILNETIKLLAMEKATGTRLRIRVISKFYSRSKSDCAFTPYFDAIEDDRFKDFPPYSKDTRAIIYDLIGTPETNPFCTFNDSVKDAHHLFFSRFRFKPFILSDAQKQFKTLTEGKNNILGIHFRGTDKTRGDRWAEGNPIDAVEFMTYAKALLKAYPEIEGVYITSDEQDFIDFARRDITTHPVFAEDLQRKASHGLGLHTMPGDPAAKAKEAIMIMLMLSKCRYLLKTTSFLSAWAKVINPDLIAFVPQMPRVETGGYVFPDSIVYETADPIPAVSDLTA